MKKVRLFASVLLLIGVLTTNVFAAQYLPSVETQDAPTVDKVMITDQDGNEVSSGSIELAVTPVSKADEAPTQDISDALTSAMDDIQKADSLAALPSESGTIRDDLQAALDSFDTDFTVEDLVVRDLFDVSIIDENAELLKDTGTTVTLTFQVDVQSDEVLIVLHNYETGKWEVIDSSLVKINGDGTVSVTMDSLSPIAFVTAVEQDEPDNPVNPDKPDKPSPDKGETVTSPQTGESVNMVVVLAVALLLAATAFCVVRAKRLAR